MKKIFVMAMLCIVSHESFGQKQKKKFADTVNATPWIWVLWSNTNPENVSADSLTFGDDLSTLKPKFNVLKEERALSLALYLVQNAGDTVHTAVLSKSIPNIIFMIDEDDQEKKSFVEFKYLIIDYSVLNEEWNVAIEKNLKPMQSKYSRFFCLKRRDYAYQ